MSTLNNEPAADMPAGTAPAADSRQGESYLDIVWKQFKKNRPAYLALWMLVPFAATAIFAPLLASNQPLVYFDGEGYLFPWWRSLFNTAEHVDFVFNIAMLMFVPWLVISFLSDRGWKQKGYNARRRFFLSQLEYLGLIAIAWLVLMLVPSLQPTNKLASRTFVVEETQNEKAWGIYPLIPYGPLEQDDRIYFSPPSLQGVSAMASGDQKKSTDNFPHLLGTDNVGRDVLARMIYGTRISMTVGFVAVGIYLTIGVIVGALAGYFGGIIDILISRIIEIVLLFPAFFLILTIVGLTKPSIFIIMVVIGLTSWPTIARLIRGEVLKQRGIDYVTAARALGSSNTRIIFRHILPNAISPAMVAAPFGVASAIITEAALSLLGIGVQPPAPTWGILLKLGSQNYNYWWLVVIPSVAIFVTVTVFNLVGNGLRDAMDPRLRH